MCTPAREICEGRSAAFTTPQLSRRRATPIVFKDSLPLPRDNIPEPIDLLEFSKLRYQDVRAIGAIAISPLGPETDAVVEVDMMREPQPRAG